VGFKGVVAVEDGIFAGVDSGSGKLNVFGRWKLKFGNATVFEVELLSSKRWLYYKISLRHANRLPHSFTDEW
jgi:hypothetical protein